MSRRRVEVPQNPLLDKFTERLAERGLKTADLLLAGSAAVAGFKKAQTFWRSKSMWTVAVPGDDWLYADVHTWLLRTTGESNVKALLVATEAPAMGRLYPGEWDENTYNLALFSDDRSSHKVNIKGQRVTVMVNRPEISPTSGDIKVVMRQERIVFTATSAAGRDAVVELLRELSAEKRHKGLSPKFRVYNAWGEWQNLSDVPPRSLDSVVLAEGQSEAIVADLEGFLASEHEYNRRGIPFHRGYLFHGPPGGGKTSLAKALANHFGLDLWFLPLGDLTKDSNLLSAIGSVRSRSILLLEDLDVFHSATSRDDDAANRTTMSGLLNALDGVSTPHGLITIMTTNNVEALDSALLRPGRVDRSVLIDFADNEQANRLFEFFFGVKPRRKLVVWSNNILTAKMSTAELMEVFIRHMGDPAGAEAEVHKLKVAA